jgi:Calcineurin-like phosphoesterase
MRRFRDSQSPRSPGLRTLVVLGLVVTVVLSVVVAETPLGGSTAAPTWLHLGTAGSTAGSVLPPTDEPGAPVLAKRKRHKRKRHKLLAAGDIASCSSSGDEATAKLLDSLAGKVVTLGDNVYDSGTASEFTNCYGPSWGRHKRRTRPAVGNHEYVTSGASGYFGYFGAAAGDPKKGYYSYNLGAWHIVALNSNCDEVGGCDAGSPQETWLRQDLKAHPTKCTLAYWHHPRFSFGNYRNDTRMEALWQALDAVGAEIVLAGHDHNYQRWAPQNPDGTLDRERGIRQFVVGTGGRNHYSLGSPPANVEASNDETFGILKLILRPTSYGWKFVPVAGKTFTDTGSGTCH